MWTSIKRVVLSGMRAMQKDGTSQSSNLSRYLTDSSNFDFQKAPSFKIDPGI